jgi:bifunctional non-homologous end joining protein LigD
MGTNLKPKREVASSNKVTLQPPADSLTALPDSPPAFIAPMQAKLVDRLPAGDQWRYELKLDGYRAIAIKTGSGARLISRNEKDLSGDYPELVDAVRQLPLREGVLDGEVVVLDEEGKPSFQALQNVGRSKRERLIYFAFDLLNLESKSLLSLPLVERARLLASVLAKAPPRVRLAGFLV